MANGLAAGVPESGGAPTGDPDRRAEVARFAEAERQASGERIRQYAEQERQASEARIRSYAASVGVDAPTSPYGSEGDDPMSGSRAGSMLSGGDLWSGSRAGLMLGMGGGGAAAGSTLGGTSVII